MEKKELNLGYGLSVLSGCFWVPAPTPHAHKLSLGFEDVAEFWACRSAVQA